MGQPAGHYSYRRSYHLVAPGSACIPVKIAVPSFVEKKAPHLGHLNIVSFGVSWVVHEHPKQNKDMTAIAQKIISQLRIGSIPSIFFNSFHGIMQEICGSINRSEELSQLSHSSQS